mmetsp:Transcript_50690/g.91276  ORF Transcript_50690/g.91276 Transcript_50690/m.91276 type:complete len:345 (+) Transcript_50690:980-2014(+)
MQLEPGFDALHLLPGGPETASERVEARVDLLFRHRHASSNECVDVCELLPQVGLFLGQPLQAGGQVILQVQQVAEVLPMVQQILLRSDDLLLAWRDVPRPTLGGFHRQNNKVGIVPRQVCKVLCFLVQLGHELLAIQAFLNSVDVRQPSSALLLVLVEQADAQNNASQLLQLRRLLRGRQRHEGPQTDAREHRLEGGGNLPLDGRIFGRRGVSRGPRAPEEEELVDLFVKDCERVKVLVELGLEFGDPVQGLVFGNFGLSLLLLTPLLDLGKSCLVACLEAKTGDPKLFLRQDLLCSLLNNDLRVVLVDGALREEPVFAVHDGRGNQRCQGFRDHVAQLSASKN